MFLRSKIPFRSQVSYTHYRCPFSFLPHKSVARVIQLMRLCSNDYLYWNASHTCDLEYSCGQGRLFNLGYGLDFRTNHAVTRAQKTYENPNITTGDLGRNRKVIRKLARYRLYLERGFRGNPWSLTPWSRVESRSVSQEVPRLSRNPKFTAVFLTARHWTPSSGESYPHILGLLLWDMFQYYLPSAPGSAKWYLPFNISK